MYSTDSIQLLLFGWAREALGAQQIDIDNMHGKTVGDLKKHLDTLSELNGRLQECMIAINHRYAPDDAILLANDEIALIPPVSGG